MVKRSTGLLRACIGYVRFLGQYVMCNGMEKGRMLLFDGVVDV